MKNRYAFIQKAGGKEKIEPKCHKKHKKMNLFKICI